jgi:hypothetical protein
MKRLLVPGMVVVLLSSCAMPPERVSLQPLPENGPPLPYAELITRARAQATSATESFYLNRWNDLQDAAKALEQTARFMAKAEEVPPRVKDTLAVETGDLAKEANKLKEAAAAQNVKDATDTLQRIHLKVRQLRPVD